MATPLSLAVRVSCLRADLAEAGLQPQVASWLALARQIQAGKRLDWSGSWPAHSLVPREWRQDARRVLAELPADSRLAVRLRRVLVLVRAHPGSGAPGAERSARVARVRRLLALVRLPVPGP